MAIRPMARHGFRSSATLPERLRRYLDAVLAFALIGLLIGLGARLVVKQETTIEGAAYAIDGDTLYREGQRLRLTGIDAPELDQTCFVADRPVPCGRRARDALRDLVRERVICTSVSHDLYGRPLVRCRTSTGDVAERMVTLGHAVATGCCRSAEAEARRAGRGLWAGRFDLPSEWRKLHRRQSAS
jgi:endonuclease YncB( thermonuclease family)